MRKLTFPLMRAPIAYTAVLSCSGFVWLHFQSSKYLLSVPYCWVSSRSFQYHLSELGMHFCVPESHLVLPSHDRAILYESLTRSEWWTSSLVSPHCYCACWNVSSWCKSAGMSFHSQWSLCCQFPSQAKQLRRTSLSIAFLDSVWHWHFEKWSNLHVFMIIHTHQRVGCFNYCQLT